MSFRFQFRRGTTAERNASNPILAAGEPAVVLDSGQPAELVLGDGVTAMADLRAAVWDDDARLALADTATQPGDLGTAAAADVADLATAAQGAKADAADAALVPLPAATGLNDTTAIQAILTANPGKRIAGRPGSSYRISAPLVIASGTTLDMTGCTVTLIPGSNCRMIQNAAFLGSGARDVDITIRGGYWDRGANGATTSNDAHSIVLHRADRVAVTDVRFTATGACKYSVYLCDVTYGRVERCDFTSTSDGVHITGPASQITVRDVSGYTDDDLISFTARDYTSYELTAGGGAITDVVVERVTMRGGDGNAVKLLPGAATTLSAAVVRDVSGTSLVSGVTINSDNAHASTTGGTVRDVLIENVTFAPGTSSACVDIICPDVSNLRLRNITQKSATSTQAVHLTGASLGDIEIDGLTSPAAHVNTLVKVATGCGIARLRIANVLATQGAGAGMVLASSGAVASLHMAGIRQTAGSSLVYIAAGTMPLITINGLHCTADFGVRVVANAPVEVQFANVTATTGNHLVRAEGATASVVIRGAALATGIHFNRTATQTMRAIGLEVRGDVSKLTPAAGDVCTNTNGSIACGTGPVVSNGTLWKHLYTGATT